MAIGRVPVTPVVKGRPVPLVKVTLVGVPNTGVTKVGLVENTKFVDVVPVVPAAVNPVMLLNRVMLAVEPPVPPADTGNVPVVNALVEDAYTAPPDVNDVSPVPPFAVPSVPAKVIAPVVAVLGVNPVVPALNEDAVAVVAIFTKSEPFQEQRAFSPATKVTPVVGPAPRKTIDCVLPVALITIYALLWAGAVMFRVTVPDAVHKRMASRA